MTISSSRENLFLSHGADTAHFLDGMAVRYGGQGDLPGTAVIVRIALPATHHTWRAIDLSPIGKSGG